MSPIALVTRSVHFDVVFSVNMSELRLSRIGQQSYHTVLDQNSDGDPTAEAWRAAPRKRELQELVMNSTH